MVVRVAAVVLDTPDSFTLLVCVEVAALSEDELTVAATLEVLLVNEVD